MLLAVLARCDDAGSLSLSVSLRCRERPAASTINSTGQPRVRSWKCQTVSSERADIGGAGLVMVKDLRMVEDGSTQKQCRLQIASSGVSEFRGEELLLVLPVARRQSRMVKVPTSRRSGCELPTG